MIRFEIPGPLAMGSELKPQVRVTKVEPPVGFEPTTPALGPDAWYQVGKAPFCPESRGFYGQRQLTNSCCLPLIQVS